MNFSLFGLDLDGQLFMSRPDLDLDDSVVVLGQSPSSFRASWTWSYAIWAGPQASTAQRCPTHQIMGDGHQQYHRGDVEQTSDPELL